MDPSRLTDHSQNIHLRSTPLDLRSNPLSRKTRPSNTLYQKTKRQLTLLNHRTIFPSHRVQKFPSGGTTLRADIFKNLLTLGEKGGFHYDELKCVRGGDVVKMANYKL